MVKVKVNGKELAYPVDIDSISPYTATIGILSEPVVIESAMHIMSKDNIDDIDYMKVVDDFADLNEVVGYHHKKGIMPDKVIFNDGATVLFNDDEKIVVKCDDEDTYNKMFGFLYGYFLMNSGMTKSQARKFFDKFGYDMPVTKKKKIEKKKTMEIENIVNDKSLSIDEFEKRMRNLLDDYMA